MMAHGGNGQEMIKAESMEQGFDIPSLNEKATSRDIAAYMKAFKASVANISPCHKQRIATSIQQALSAQDLTTETLNGLLLDPTIHRTFSQPETKQLAMDAANPNAGHARMPVNGHSPVTPTAQRPRSRPAPSATAATQYQHHSSHVPVTQKEWEVLQHVPPQQKAAVMQTLRQTPPQYLAQPGYHTFHPQQLGGMPGYPPGQPVQYDANIDPALRGIGMPPPPPPQTPSNRCMPASPYRSGPNTPTTPLATARVTPRASPGASPSSRGYRSNGSQMAHGGAHALSPMQPARYYAVGASQRVELFAQPRPGSASAIPQIVQAASAQPTEHWPGRPRSVQGSPRQTLHHGYMAHPSVARSNVQRSPVQRFVPVLGTGAIPDMQTSFLQPTTPTPSRLQGHRPNGQPDSQWSVSVKTPKVDDPAYWDANAAHWMVYRAGFDRRNWTGYLNPAVPQKRATAGKAYHSPDESNAVKVEAIEQKDVHSTESTSPSVVEVDTAGTLTLVEPVEKNDIEQGPNDKDEASAAVDGENDDDANVEKAEEPVLPGDKSKLAQDDTDAPLRGSWDESGLEELFPEFGRRYGAHGKLDEIFPAVNGQLGAPAVFQEANASGTNNTRENVDNLNHNLYPANSNSDNTHLFEEEKFDLTDFDPAIFDQLFNGKGDWLSDEQVTSAVANALNDHIAEDAADMARLRAKTAATTRDEAIAAAAPISAAAADEAQAASSSSCSTPDAASSSPATINPGNNSHNLISDQTTNVVDRLSVREDHDEQDKEEEIKIPRPRGCEQCGRMGTTSTCCLENLTRQHPDVWSFLHPMVRHNCIVYDRIGLTQDTDLGKPVMALYPHLIGQSAKIHFGDEEQTVLDAPIMQLPDKLRFIPSMTIFPDGSAFANDPIGATEYMTTGRVVADGLRSSEDQGLIAYRSYWGETGARAVIGRKEAEAKKLISLFTELEGSEQTAEHRASVTEKLHKRSLDAIHHEPGSGHSCGAGSNEYLVYNPRMLPAYVEDESIDLVHAIEGANTLNMLQNGVTPELTSYIPADLTDMDARAKIPFTIVVRLSHAPQIFELIPDAAHANTERGVAGQQFLRYGGKILTVLAIEMRRRHVRSDSEIFSTMRRLVPHFDDTIFTENDLPQWRSQMLRNEEYLEFYWIVRAVVRMDFRGIKLLRMIWENDARLFDTKRDDEMDTLGLTLTLEEMLRIAGKAVKEEMDRSGKRGREEDFEMPAAKRART